MKALKIIGIILIVIAVLVFGAILALPDSSHIERSVVIEASPQEVLRELVTYRNFNKWSPWYKMDTTAQYTWEGPPYGVGCKMSWESTADNVGSGSMEITEVTDNSITYLMKFGGYDSSPTATFIVEPAESGSKVTWTYDESGLSGLGKIFGMMMDSFLGPDYESGLSNLKAWIESGPKSTTIISVTHVSPIPYLGISDVSANDDALLGTKMSKNYGKLNEVMVKLGTEPGGAPFAIITDYSPEEISFICAIPYKGIIETTPEGIIKSTNYSGMAIKSVYNGAYSGTGTAHEEISGYADFAGYEISGAPWEEYVTNPSDDSDTSKWVTYVFYPVK